MDRDIINRYIAIPMAIKVFQQDQKEFQKFKIGNLYLDLLDSIIEQLKSDFLELKKEMYSFYHIDIKYVGRFDNVEQYKVNNRTIIEYTPGELKELTREIMEGYIYGDKAKPFERKERINPN